MSSIDETVAALGEARASSTDAILREMILRVQRDLFVVAADLIASPDHPVNPQARNYLNRVSDLLYVLARQAAGDDEEPVSHEAELTKTCATGENAKNIDHEWLGRVCDVEGVVLRWQCGQ